MHMHMHMHMPDNLVPKDIASIGDPKLRDVWYKAYDTEILGLIQNGTLKPMRRPAKVRVLPLKEIASRKSDGGASGAAVSWAT